MGKWTIEETDQGLRLAPLRALGFDHFTWAHLLYGRLSPVQVYVLYFPSRFDLPMDTYVIDTLRTFGTNKGTVFSILGWHQKALEAFERASSLDSKNVLAHRHKAEAMVALQRPEDALAAYVQVITLDPDDLETRINQGLLLAELKRYKEAMGACTHLRQLSLSDDSAALRRRQGMLDIEASLPVGTIFTTLKGHTSEVKAVAWSPDGQRIASAGSTIWGSDKAIQLWDADTGEILSILKGHTSAVCDR